MYLIKRIANFIQMCIIDLRYKELDLKQNYIIAFKIYNPTKQGGGENMTISATDLKSELAQCSGTMQYHKLTLGPLKATDGVAIMAQKAEAFWLVDAIASYQQEPKIKELRIQFWTLEVKEQIADLYCIEDKGQPKLVEQHIPHTDFPEGKWDFYVADGVIMLPSEY